jgi:UDP-N-acetylmuramyl pentapeptide phosphotransferase/UDP-N-acetylglucosamine-1-phosphate transferase
VALILALPITLLLTPLMARVAFALGVIDRPGPLKVHQQPVAYLGGLAVFGGLAVPMAFGQAALLVPMGLAVLLGLADDVHQLPAPLRLVAQLVIGVAAAAALPGSPSLAGAIALVIAVVVLVNAVNLLDGLDGLAAAVAAVGAIGFAIVLDGADRSTALALVGALGGFLPWNLPPARIYLGDAGSYLVGTGLALLLGLSATSQETWASGAGALLFVGVPVADTVVAVVRRARAGRPLLEGDRGHIYDQLVDRGWTPTRVTTSCVLAQGVLVAIGLAATTLDGAPGIALVAGIVASVGVAVLWTFTSPASWTST